MKYFIVIFAVFLCGVSSYPRKEEEPQCQVPNGGGITPVIKEFIDILPLDEIFAIYLNAVNNDPEVQAVMEYLESDDFLAIFKAVTGSSEFAKLVKTACDELYLDVINYINLLNKVLGLPNIPRPVLKIADDRRPGLYGMLEDIIELINVDALKELFIEKSKTDEYVKKALEIVKSQDFQNIIDTLHKTPAYNKMLNDLRDIGVNVDAIIKLLNRFLGW